MFRACLLAIGWMLAVTGSVAADSPTRVSDLAETAKQRASETRININPLKYDDAQRERVRQLAEQGKQRGLEQLQQMRRDYVAKPGNEDLKPLVDAAKTADSGRLVIALSSSMPEEMIRDYLRQLDGVSQAKVILRGFIGGASAVKPTGYWVEKMRRKISDCRDCGHLDVQVLVDPLLYRQLDIQRVPAVAWLPGLNEISHCDGPDGELPKSIAKVSSSVAYGAVSIRSALEALLKEGVAVPNSLIEQFRSKGWHQQERS